MRRLLWGFFFLLALVVTIAAFTIGPFVFAKNAYEGTSSIERRVDYRDPALMTWANDPALRIIVHFHRGPMFGRGHGHFSPVLGYLPDRDLVLVGDVNAEYRPYLVPAERLWRATDKVDDATRKERGILLVRANAALRKAAGLN